MRPARLVRSSLIAIGLLVLAIALGPRPGPAPLDGAPLDPAALDLAGLRRSVERDDADPALKPDNGAAIVWAGAPGDATECSIVYLHGFSASRVEGAPTHRRIAERFGCNLYLARICGHGFEDGDALARATPQCMVDSAREAVRAGKLLGERVLVMATSTGATLALYLAASDPSLEGLVLFSPNVRLANPFARLLCGPWGREVNRLVHPSGRRSWSGPPGVEDHWTTEYPIEALVNVQCLLRATMRDEVFEQVAAPTLVLYYYQDEERQDDVVSVAAIREMTDALGTPDAERRVLALDSVGNHALASRHFSTDLERVESEVAGFLVEVVGLAEVAAPRQM